VHFCLYVFKKQQGFTLGELLISLDILARFITLSITSHDMDGSNRNYTYNLKAGLLAGGGYEA